MKQSDHTPYWCTCSVDPKLCLGCGIEHLVKQVLGDPGHLFLTNRIYKVIKQPEKK